MKRTVYSSPPKIGLVRKSLPVSNITTSEDNIENYIFPALDSIGYGATWLTRDEVHLKQKVKEIELYGKINPRLLLKGSRLLLEIFPLETPTYKIVVQPFVRENTTPSELQNLPRYNFPSELTEELETRPEAIRVKLVRELLYILDLHFLIITKTGQFWMDKYAGIPESQYRLTWRKDPSKPDRICAVADASIGQFTSIQKGLKDRLLTLMYYFNKNNKYDRK